MWNDEMKSEIKCETLLWVEWVEVNVFSIGEFQWILCKQNVLTTISDERVSG